MDYYLLRQRSDCRCKIVVYFKVIFGSKLRDVGMIELQLAVVQCH